MSLFPATHPQKPLSSPWVGASKAYITFPHVFLSRGVFSSQTPVLRCGRSTRWIHTMDLAWRVMRYRATYPCTMMQQSAIPCDQIWGVLCCSANRDTANLWTKILDSGGLLLLLLLWWLLLVLYTSIGISCINIRIIIIIMIIIIIIVIIINNISMISKRVIIAIIIRRLEGRRQGLGQGRRQGLRQGRRPEYSVM